jgi:hypothetical protein
MINTNSAKIIVKKQALALSAIIQKQYGSVNFSHTVGLTEPYWRKKGNLPVIVRFSH